VRFYRRAREVEAQAEAPEMIGPDGALERREDRVQSVRGDPAPVIANADLGDVLVAAKRDFDRLIAAEADRVVEKLAERPL
jgi:hypothetical protein